MKTITLAASAMLALTAFSTTAMSQSPAADTAFEKKSYNYAEWAKGRFSEVVTVRNPGKIIYLGGIGAEDEDSAKGGVIRHLGDFGGGRDPHHLQPRGHLAQQVARLHRDYRGGHQHRQRVPDHGPHAEDVQAGRKEAQQAGVFLICAIRSSKAAT